MANKIRIKRRSTDSTAPTTSQVVNGELAFNENNDILYYGEGGNDTASTAVLKIGGAGAFLTMDTNQTPTGVKTFSTTTLSITGGSNGNVLSTNGSGTLTWASVSANAFSNITDGTNTAAASGGDTFKLRASSPLSVVVANNDVTHGDNALFSVSAASTSAAGVVQLSDSTSTTSSTVAATSTAVKSAYDLANAALPKSGGTMTGAITLYGDPSSALHAATKQYVDNTAQGLDVKQSVRAATTADLGSITYSNGSSGVGATITNAGVQVAFPSQDGVTSATNMRILVKNQSTASQNGIYTLTTLGDLSTNWVLTRATDFDDPSKGTGLQGAFAFVEQGTTQADSGWVCTTDGAITIGTTGLTFSQFSGAGQITAGAGLTKSGNTLDIGTANVTRIVVNADNIDLATVSRGADLTTATPTITFLTGVTSDSYGRVTSATVENVRTGSTSQTGILQLTDSTSSTSTSTAATPASVKSAYDLANAALPKAGGTMTGKITTVTTSTSTANILLAGAAADPSAPASGDFWNNNGTIKFYNGTATKTIAFTDSNITGTAANVSGTVAIANGGTGATTQQAAINALAGAVTSGSFLRGNGTNVLMGAIQVSDVPTLNQNTTGSAATLTTSRTFQTDLASTSSASFNGSANVTPGVTGTLGAANGGTGQSTYAVGDILYASASTTLSKLAGVATGNALISGGVTTAPSWGKIGLTTHVTGTLPVANGGTGATTFTANGILYGNTTSAVGVTAQGTVDGAGIGQLLTVNASNVPTWTNTVDGGTY